MNQTDHLVRADMLWFLSQAKPRRLRSMREFAETEIVIPSGPFAGSRFRCHRQPYTKLWFDEVDSGRWQRMIATGPSQSGKTLSCFVIPLLFHLFEVGETVICGLPDMDMASDKWREDILPVIERTQFRKLLPQTGAGSRGGTTQSIQFRNGATLRFMSGGGGDKSRAGFTSRVVVITETDGMDEQGRNSREADKISQLIARTRAFGHRSRIYMECTVSTETGRTWQEYSSGTRSRIAIRCPLCSAFVTPEREHLVGWRESETQVAARNASRFCCPACGESWSEEERKVANQNSVLLHDGQSVDAEGSIAGTEQVTGTFGFRWSAVNNLFLTASELGAEEWQAARSADEENAERERRQFVWCLPVVPNKWQVAELETSELANRFVDIPRGQIPVGTKYLTAAIDLGKYLDHWMVIAWSEGPLCHVVDYGRLEVSSNDLGVEQASMIALRQFRDLVNQGWPVVASDQYKVPDVVLIDAGYMTDVVYAFCRESAKKFLPSVGRGASQQHKQWYNRPTQTGSIVKFMGEGYHINWLPAEKLYLVELDADHWKTWVHQRLVTPVKNIGAMTYFHASAHEHLSLAKHLTAEVKTEEFVAGKGLVTKWERKRQQNHWLDCMCYASVAGHYCGVRIVKETPKPKPPPPPPISKPHKEPWIDTERWRETQRRIWGRRDG